MDACTFSPDGRFAAIGSLTGGARVWRADGTGEPAVIGDPRAQVQVVEFSPDGTRVAIVPFGRPVEIWSASGTGQPVRIPLPGGTGSPAHMIKFTSDGQQVLFSWSNGLAELWNADGEGAPMVLRGHEGALSAALFSPDGREIVTARTTAPHGSGRAVFATIRLSSRAGRLPRCTSVQTVATS